MTYLSPYISRGVISTRQVYNHIRKTGIPWQDSEKLIQELAWRDYWQQVWVHKGEQIFEDLKHDQLNVCNREIPNAIIQAKTDIAVVDNAILDLYHKGYMHNHMRMYVSSICCNIAKSHWLAPAKWLYAHLLDGDLASNHLSWQWVAGAFSNKQYYANQDNINKYFKSFQKNTFLDVDYSEFPSLEVPPELVETSPFKLGYYLPQKDKPKLNMDQNTLIYNYYNLDPHWHKDGAYQRILLLEPSVFKKHPVKKNCIEFAIALSHNIPEIKIFVGEFSELTLLLKTDHIIYKEHPLNTNYSGIMEEREWLTSVRGYFPSFFKFWKKAKKELEW